VKIGIIGGGNVGGTLYQRFKQAGHDVRVGVPDASAVKYESIDALSPEQAAQHGEVVFFAIPWSAMESAVTQLEKDLVGKIVVDSTNPIAPDFSGLLLGHTTSAGQTVAAWLPKSKVVKAFNTLGFNIIANPDFGETGATLVIAGDDQDAKSIVSGLATDIGFSPVEVGPIARAAQTEALAWLWIQTSIRIGREFNFNLITRPGSS
jgi:predicted dinucleotide-binding enzyme